MCVKSCSNEDGWMYLWGEIGGIDKVHGKYLNDIDLQDKIFVESFRKSLFCKFSFKILKLHEMVRREKPMCVTFVVVVDVSQKKKNHSNAYINALCQKIKINSNFMTKKDKIPFDYMQKLYEAFLFEKILA